MIFVTSLSLHRYLVSLHRYLFSLHRYLFSLHRYLFSLHRYLFSLHRYLFSLHRLFSLHDDFRYITVVTSFNYIVISICYIVSSCYINIYIMVQAHRDYIHIMVSGVSFIISLDLYIRIVVSITSLHPHRGFNYIVTSTSWFQLHRYIRIVVSITSFNQMNLLFEL